MFSGKISEVSQMSIGNRLLTSSRDGDLATVKHLLEQCSSQSCLSALIECQNGAGNTPLHLAVMFGHIGIVEFLVYNGANIYHKNDYSCTPFNQACLRVQSIQNTDSHPLLDSFEKILAIFLARGFDLNATSRQTKSYLGALASANVWGAMQILLKHGANINIQDQFGQTPLHCAAIHGRREAVFWLLGHGADMQVLTDKRLTAWDLAVENLKLSQKRGHEYPIKDCLIILEYLKRKESMETKPAMTYKYEFNDGSHYVKTDHILQEEEQNVLSHILSFFPHCGNSTWVQKFASLPFELFDSRLLKIAANAYDRRGNTVLGVACENGRSVAFVQKLIDLGANLNIPDQNMNKLALHWAICNKLSFNNKASYEAVVRS